jgi:hypothetical protein
MSVRFYFSAGIKFQDALATLKKFCDYDPNPNGAPLGEEPTQYSYFDEAGCRGWGTFSRFIDRQRFSISGASLKSDVFSSRSLCAMWNPNLDTLIHVLYLNFSDYVLFPTRDYKWEESQPVAPKIYKTYKDLFVEFKCDEGQALSEHGSVLFRWVRASDYQSIIKSYERDKEMTLEEAQSWNWRDYRLTEEVFPEISAEYEAKYNERLDYMVDW